MIMEDSGFKERIEVEPGNGFLLTDNSSRKKPVAIAIHAFIRMPMRTIHSDPNDFVKNIFKKY